jgi:hypothetical protein
VATLKDVARLAGVGMGTASRVVSGKGSVSPAKRELVQKAIESLNFRPSHVARSLMLGSTQTIGVYIPVLSGTFYTPILQIIDAELQAAGMQMVVAFGSGKGGARAQAVKGIEFLMPRCWKRTWPHWVRSRSGWSWSTTVSTACPTSASPWTMCMAVNWPPAPCWSIGIARSP